MKIKFLLYFLILIFILSKVNNRINSNFVSSLADGFTNLKKTITPKNKLVDLVAKEFEGTKGIYAIVIKNLKTNEAYFKNEKRIFEPGSLYKLWVMAVVFQKIEAGELKEDEVLSQNIRTLNKEFNIDPDNAELTSGTITMTIENALFQMITISHNYSALLLTEKVGNSNLQKFLDDNGFEDSKVGGPPQTTASDISLFFEKLYKGELANSENTQKMLTLLGKQTLNNKLPKYLPSEIIVAHKTGEIDYFTHDAGIVFLPKGDYIIVVLSESDLPIAAEDRIANLSKAVYDYFLQN